MRKKGYLAVMVISIMFVMSGCCLKHEWKDATCTEPMTCVKCEKTEGEALGHTWRDATCTEAKTCSVCGATEGEALGHTWEEATCTAPKTCRVCKATEGEMLEHKLTEANYQQAPTCEVCGTVVGEPLEARFADSGVREFAELDRWYEVTFSCYPDEKKKTVGKVKFTNYKVFESDEDRPAKDGYVWKSVDITIVVGDDSAYKNGYQTAVCFDDYYEVIKWHEEDSDKFDINYNGIDYTECQRILTSLEDTGWIRNDMSNDSSAAEDGIDWPKIVRSLRREEMLVPEGYDGILFGPVDPKGVLAGGEKDFHKVPQEEYLLFRCY